MAFLRPVLAAFAPRFGLFPGQKQRFSSNSWVCLALAHFSRPHPPQTGGGSGSAPVYSAWRGAAARAMVLICGCQRSRGARYSPASARNTRSHRECGMSRCACLWKLLRMRGKNRVTGICGRCARALITSTAAAPCALERHWSIFWNGQTGWASERPDDPASEPAEQP